MWINRILITLSVQANQKYSNGCCLEYDTILRDTEQTCNARDPNPAPNSVGVKIGTNSIKKHIITGFHKGFQNVAKRAVRRERGRGGDWNGETLLVNDVIVLNHAFLGYFFQSISDLPL